MTSSEVAPSTFSCSGSTGEGAVVSREDEDSVGAGISSIFPHLGEHSASIFSCSKNSTISLSVLAEGLADSWRIYFLQGSS